MKLNIVVIKNSISFRPVFLIGCGRSGTTILGRTLEKHRIITYLNERRDLWHKAYPEFDIWSNTVNSKLVAKKNDNKKNKTKILTKLFHKEQVLEEGAVLLEKLPINSFRLEFIEAAFPNARYIYLHRNGLEVAKSIEKRCLNGGWFGKKDRKWRLLEAELSSEIKALKKNFSFFEKGLLEWRYSIQFSEDFFAKLAQERFYSLSYNVFVEDPSGQIKNIFNFLKLEYTEDEIIEMTKDIRRKTTEITSIDEWHKQLGGEHLK